MILEKRETILLQSHNFVVIEDWQSIYGSEAPETEINLSEVQTIRKEVKGKGVWVHHCVFHNSQSHSQKGGAIYASRTLLLVEQSTFTNCSSTLYGGAIYELDGECVVKQCCSEICYSEQNGQFVYTSHKNLVQYQSKVLESSASHSMNGQTPSYGSILYFYNGAINVDKMNISNSICDVFSALLTFPSVSTEVTGSMTYSSISSIETKRITLISFSSSKSKYAISHSNVINNSVSAESKSGLIHSSGPSTISDCCLIKNKAQIIFESDNDDEMRIMNCSVDFDLKKSNSGNVIIESEAENDFIIPIFCVQTEKYCIVSFGTLPYLIEKTKVTRIVHFSLLLRTFIIIVFVH